MNRSSYPGDMQLNRKRENLRNISRTNSHSIVLLLDVLYDETENLLTMG